MAEPRQGVPKNKKFIEEAEELVKQYVHSYTTDLMLQSVLIAKREHSEVVTSDHVIAASEVVRRSDQRKWLREAILAVGGGVMGASLHGFIAEVNTLHPSVHVIVAWAITFIFSLAILAGGALRRFD